MKTYICKFLFGDRKHSFRIRAYSFESAAEGAVKMVCGTIGGTIVDLYECPVQIGAVI